MLAQVSFCLNEEVRSTMTQLSARHIFLRLLYFGQRMVEEISGENGG